MQPKYTHLKPAPHVCGQLTIAPVCGYLPNGYHKGGSIRLYRMSLCAIVLHFLFTGTKRLKPDPV